jgi:hypothetical protein
VLSLPALTGIRNRTAYDRKNDIYAPTLMRVGVFSYFAESLYRKEL